MRVFFVALAVVYFSTSMLAQEGGQKAESKTPLMVSFTDLKWVELPERKGMQFALLSGDPKTGPYTQIRKVPAGTDNPLHSHSSEIKNVIISGVWYTGKDAASAKDFGPGVGRDDAGRLGACERLSVRKRLCLLPGGQRQIRFQTFCGPTLKIG
jgi:hypothetical protein